MPNTNPLTMTRNEREAFLADLHVGIISITFSKLGLTRESAFLLLFFSLFGSHHRKCHSLFSHASGSTHAVHVDFGGGRHVVVDDVAEPVDVQAAGEGKPHAPVA